MTTSEAALSNRFCTALLGEQAGENHLVWRGRTFSAGWTVRIGTLPHFLRSESGRIVECRRGLPLMPDVRLSLSASALAWEAFWQPIPLPGWHDLFALSKRGALHFEGDMQLMLAHLQYLKDVLALPRLKEQA